MPGHSIRDFDLLPTDSIKRHLAAIVAADVVGYSRLMGADEKGTLLALKAHRAELIDPLIAAHKGHIVKTTGDGLLLTFPSIVEAVSCAVAMQSGMAKRNQDIPARPPHRIPHRRQHRRRHRREGRRVRRRRQYRGAARADRAAGRHLPIRGRIPAGAGQARYSRSSTPASRSLKNIANPDQGLSDRAVGRRPPSMHRRRPPRADAGRRGPCARGSNRRGNRPRRDHVA